MDLSDDTITEYVQKFFCVHIRDNENVLVRRKNDIGGCV